MTVIEDWIARLRLLWRGVRSIAGEDARTLTGDDDPAVRRMLASRPDAPPDALARLAADPAAEVRRAIAANRSTPTETDRALAADADTNVRGALAAKIARLVAGLDVADQEATRQRALEILDTLVRDQAVRVRQILAETLKEIAHAPPAVIRRLAKDAEAAVSCPVLEFSPILTDADLLEIIAGNPVPNRLGAISKRKTVAEPVADAVIGAGDAAAIGVLLANPNAVIREATLDRLIDQAPAHESWHQPLVNRPALPGKAAAKLARFVAENFLQALQDRQDLPADVLAEVRREVEKRLGDSQPGGGATANAASAPEDAMKMAREHLEAGHLDERMVAEAVRTGDREFAIAALALRARLPVEAVRKAVAERDARGVLAIAWQAGLDVKLAEMLQQRLAAVAPGDVIRAAGQEYPMTADALAWQLDFLKKSL